MNKVNGKREDFAYFREDGSRIVIGYGLKELENGLYEWHEVYFYKKQTAQLSFQIVKDAIENDINSRVDEEILCTFS